MHKPDSERKTDRAYLLCLSVLWLAAVLLVNPTGDFPVTDDWAYAESVRTLLATGTIRFSDWNATTLFTQIFWGALFGWVAGPSNTVLRVSTLVAAWLGAIAFYRLVRLARGKPEVALLAALALLFNPLSFLLSFSFMTDLPFTGLQTAAMWLLATGMLTGAQWPRVVGWITAAAALLIRQVGFAIAVGSAGEALVRERWSVRRVALAIAPFFALLVVQKLFEAWLDTNALRPAMYGRQITSIPNVVNNPAQTLRNVVTVLFQCALYLGFFTMPLGIAVASAWRKQLPSRWIGWAVVGAAIFATIAVVGVGIRFPSWIVSLQRGGIGQDVSGRLTPEAVAIPLTALAVCGMVAMFCGIIAAAVAWYRRNRDERFDITVFALVMGLCLLGPLPFVALRVDRYLIPIVPCVLLVLVELFRTVGPSRLGQAAGYASVGLMALASVCTMHDEMEAKRAQWAAYNDLIRHVPADHVDAGWVLNGPVSYGRHGTLSDIQGWYATDDYVIDTAMRPGFRVVGRYPVRTWLWFNRNDLPILVQQKIASATREP